MDTWRTVYEWARAILAIIGALGCLLAGLLAAFLYAQEQRYAEPTQAQARAQASVPLDPLAGADSLLNEAGIDRKTQHLWVLDADPGTWQTRDNSHISLWCLHAPGLPAEARWLASRELEPMFAIAAASTLDAAHADRDCVPDWNKARGRGLAIQPIQFIWSQRQLGHARLAMYERESGMLYLIERTKPTSPPVTKPPTDAPSIE